MYRLYRSITWLASPLIPRYLKKRQKRGKEHTERMAERFGHSAFARPAGKLLWVHAASVGESNAALPLIEKLLELHPQLHVLLTTGTVTSAALMEKRLPPHALHQFIPVDTPAAVRRFITHWRPDVALFIDSELWPNLIMDSYYCGAIMALVNARMSEHSFRKWKKGQGFIRPLLSCFTLCFASPEDAERLSKLGIRSVNHIGNLKYDVPALPCDEAELARLQRITGGRTLWLAASTHPGEEAMLAKVHNELKAQFPDLMTIIVPRHATRAEAILTDLAGLTVARRSINDPLTIATDVYLADTMGELGLFYRLAQVAFIGGSLVPHGGQNPIEALALGCPVILGPHMENFQSMCKAMLEEGACLKINDAQGLSQSLQGILNNPARQAELAAAGRAHLEKYRGSIDAIALQLQPYLADAAKSV